MHVTAMGLMEAAVARLMLPLCAVDRGVAAVAVLGVLRSGWRGVCLLFGLLGVGRMPADAKYIYISVACA